MWGVWPSCCLPCGLCGHVAATEREQCGRLPPPRGAVWPRGCPAWVLLQCGSCVALLSLQWAGCVAMLSLQSRSGWGWGAVTGRGHGGGAAWLCRGRGKGGSVPALPHVPRVCVAPFACGGPYLHMPCLVLSGVRWERMGMGWWGGGVVGISTLCLRGFRTLCLHGAYVLF